MNKQIKSQRNTHLDVWKCICSFLVVFIHFGVITSGHAGKLYSEYMISLARIAVPFFFMTTGYYYGALKKSGKLKEFFRTIGKMAIGASLFYLLFYGIYYYLDGYFYNWLVPTFTKVKILKWIFMNIDPILGSLWYLYALLYCIVILRIADFIHLKNGLYGFAIITLTTHLLLNFTPYYCHMRNFLFLGLPFVALGKWLSENRSHIIPLSYTKMICFIVVGMVLLVGEGYIYRFIHAGYRDLYISTLMIVVPIFILCIKYPQCGKHSWSAVIGNRYSAGIYIYHPFIAVLLSARYWNNEVWQFFRPFIVFFLTLSMVYIITQSKFYCRKIILQLIYNNNENNNSDYTCPSR